MVVYKRVGKACKHLSYANNAYLAAVVFFDVYFGIAHSAPSKLVHHIVVHQVGIYLASFAVGFWCYRIRHKAVGKSFKTEIFVETEIVVGASACCKIYRAFPIVGGNDV